MTNVVALQDARPAWNYTLADAAADINRKFDELTEFDRRIAHAQNRLLRAHADRNGLRYAIGDALLQVKEMLKEQDPKASFEAWCRANVRLSVRSCHRCVQHTEKINSGHIPGLKAAVAAGAVPQEWLAATCQQAEDVECALGIFRKMTHADQLTFVTAAYSEIKALIEEIDRGAA